MLFAMTLALVAALAYGVSDYLGGTAATRLRVIPTTIIGYAAALVTLGVAVGGFVAADVAPAWSGPVWFWGAVAGVAAVVGFVAFYGAMATGPMSLVSPLIALVGAGVPVVVAVLLGEVLPPAAWVGVVLAAGSAVLISAQPRTSAQRMSPRTTITSIVAGLGLGLSVVALDRAPAESGLLSAVVEMAVGLALLLVAASIARAIPALRRFFDGLGGHESAAASFTTPRARVAALAAGVLLGLANGLIPLALQAGSLAVVSVLVSLYPLATLLLVRLRTGERLVALQKFGVGLAVAASALLGVALGGA